MPRRRLTVEFVERVNHLVDIEADVPQHILDIKDDAERAAEMQDWLDRQDWFDLVQEYEDWDEECEVTDRELVAADLAENPEDVDDEGPEEPESTGEDAPVATREQYETWLKIREGR